MTLVRIAKRRNSEVGLADLKNGESEEPNRQTISAKQPKNTIRGVTYSDDTGHDDWNNAFHHLKTRKNASKMGVPLSITESFKNVAYQVRPKDTHGTDSNA